MLNRHAARPAPFSACVQLRRPGNAHALDQRLQAHGGFDVVQCFQLRTHRRRGDALLGDDRRSHVRGAPCTRQAGRDVQVAQVLHRVDIAAHEQPLGLACSRGLGIAFDLHGHALQLLARGVCRGLRRRLELGADAGGGVQEAPAVAADTRGDVVDRGGVGFAWHQHADAAGRVEGVGHHVDALAVDQAWYTTHVEGLALETDHAVAHRARLGRTGGQLPQDLHRRCQDQLLWRDTQPAITPGHAGAGVNAGGVVGPRPLLRQLVDFLQGSDRGAGLEGRFEVGLDDVVGVLDLTLGAGVAHLVDDQLDAAGVDEVPRRSGGDRAARIHHQHLGDAMHGSIAALRHRVDQRGKQVRAGLGAKHVEHLDAAAGVISDGVAPQATLGDLGEVARLATVELPLVHHLRAVVGQVELAADRGVDLPQVVRMRAGQPGGRRRRAQLVAVEAVMADGPADG